jgi:tripartite-type tricarboxylate transporter receptor subunit TctC
MALHRRNLLLGAAALGGLAANPAGAQPEAWPVRQPRFVIPFAPGGGQDVFWRLLAERLSRRLRASFIVENKGGAGGGLGAQEVVRAAPDGDTFLTTTSSIAILPALYPNLGFDPLRDLQPVSLVPEASMGFMVRPDSPIRDLVGLVVAAKAAPGRVTYGSSGTGTTTHMAAALFGVKAGMSWQHVPYGGQGQLISGFLAGDVDVMSGDLGTLLPHHREGRGRVVAVTASQRVGLLPDVPSVTEAVPGTGITI